ncbi:SpoIIE family protein phosphatase [Nonomuraea harbinensis]|uniref:SpoIIE family protein phosphatase n=1 Tax=Nonomuraea harbinensis TaxID=1286938 RepID=A0ABW1BMD7_9ACTN|nr:SpoIIE family protein phosphatase [Nonomuraea harbinensis]
MVGPERTGVAQGAHGRRVHPGNHDHGEDPRGGDGLLDRVGDGEFGGEHAVCSFRFDEGDLLLLYTDGVTEARDAAGVFYPLADRIGAWTQEAPEGPLKRVCDDLLSYTGGRLGDDAAMIAIRRMPVADSGGAYGPAATSGARAF